MMVGPSSGDIKPSSSGALLAAHQRAVTFSLSHVRPFAISSEQAKAWGEQEVQFGTVHIDEYGLSAGMKTYLIPPLRTALAEWRRCRAEFDAALQPHMADIDAVIKARKEEDDARARRDSELNGIQKRMEASENYKKIREERETAYTRWRVMQDRNAGRSANLFAYSPLYVMLICCIGVAEWFINYDVLLGFTGIPAIAAGSTAILGGVLAFAAHGYGEIFKQVSHRFSESREPSKRARDWGYLGLSTAALFIVLGAAGGSRYAWAMQVLASESHHSLLSNIGDPDVSPLRDVLISLLANVAAWLVGVFLSFFAHDENPEFANATRDWNRKHKLWAQANKPYEVEKKHVEAKCTQAIDDLAVAAKHRRALVENEINLLIQVDGIEHELNAETFRLLQANISTYRAALTSALLTAAGQAKLVLKASGEVISPFELNMRDLPDSETLKQLVGG